MNSLLRLLRLMFVTAIALLFCACASYDGRGLQTGASSDQVRALMGEPAKVWSEPDGSATWEYPHGPFGRETYMVKIGSDSKLRGIEQVLTEQMFARLALGKTTLEEVEHLIGRPNEEMAYPRLSERVWMYRYRNGSILMLLYVTFNPAGIVTNVAEVLDQADSPGPES